MDKSSQWMLWTKLLVICKESLVLWLTNFKKNWKKSKKININNNEDKFYYFILFFS